MRELQKYQTKDGVIHNSQESAESHALSHAHTELKDIFEQAVPAVPNAYAITQKIIMLVIKDKNARKKLKEFIAWMEDAE